MAAYREPIEGGPAEGAAMPEGSALPEGDAAACRDREAEIRALRREGIRRRQLLSDAQRQEAARAMAEQLFRLPVYRNADVLLNYVSYGAEADTGAVIRRALAEGRAVYCPKVCGSDMDFFRITSFLDLSPGFRGIPEPSGAGERFEFAAGAWRAGGQPPAGQRQDERRVLALVPGTAFDRAGHRIGFGGGYYDRWFGAAGLRRGAGSPLCLIGLCYACQLWNRIPFRTHDIGMDLVLTERGIWGGRAEAARDGSANRAAPAAEWRKR